MFEALQVTCTESALFGVVTPPAPFVWNALKDAPQIFLPRAPTSPKYAFKLPVVDQ